MRAGHSCTIHTGTTIADALSLSLPAVMDAREAKLRSDWVKVMEARLVREELAKCWREEGVNHYQSCHALSEKYIDMIRTHRVRERRARGAQRAGMDCTGDWADGERVSSAIATGHRIQEARLYVLDIPAGQWTRLSSAFSTWLPAAFPCSPAVSPVQCTSTSAAQRGTVIPSDLQSVATGEYDLHDAHGGIDPAH